MRPWYDTELNLFSVTKTTSCRTDTAVAFVGLWKSAMQHRGDGGGRGRSPTRTPVEQTRAAQRSAVERSEVTEQIYFLLKII